MRPSLAMVLITATVAGWWWLFAPRGSAASPRANTPAVGQATIMGGEPDGELEVGVPVCNRSNATLRANVIVESGTEGLASEAERRVVPGRVITSFTAGPGAYLYIGLFRIKPHRTQPIRFRINWQDGHETNSFAQTIAPVEDNVTHLK